MAGIWKCPICFGTLPIIVQDCCGYDQAGKPVSPNAYIPQFYSCRVCGMTAPTPICVACYKKASGYFNQLYKAGYGGQQRSNHKINFYTPYINNQNTFWNTDNDEIFNKYVKKWLQLTLTPRTDDEELILIIFAEIEYEAIFILYEELALGYDWDNPKFWQIALVQEKHKRDEAEKNKFKLREEAAKESTRIKNMRPDNLRAYQDEKSKQK
jgi:hypothetical protein